MPGLASFIFSGVFWDGARLRNLTRLIYGHDRPKQICPLFGNETLQEGAKKERNRVSPGVILRP